MMAVDERMRHELFLALEGVLGREEAVTLMEHLPPSGWEEVATKTDVAAVSKDVERVETTLRGEISLLRADMDRRFGEMDGRFGEERERVIAVVRESEQRVLATIRGEMVSAMGQQSRLMAFSLVGALTANTGLVLTALRLGT
jgi:hypothetical protein